MRVAGIALLLLAACERADDSRPEPEPPEPERHGLLGIRYVMLDGRIQVDEVLPGTPAERVGLRAGDVIWSLDGKRIEATDELQRRIWSSRPGHLATLVVERGSDRMMLQPRLAAWPTTARDERALLSQP